jgi:hypothetical protein
MIATGMRPGPRRHLELADPQGREAGEQTADETADEAGVDEACDGADGEARRDPGTVGDGVRDVAGERRYQEAEGQLPSLSSTAPR